MIKTTSIIKSLLQNILEKKIKDKTINYFFNKLINNKKKFHKAFYLNRSHIVKMLKKNMQFGYHGTSHSRLAELTKKNQIQEIKNSISLFKKLNYHSKVFCYPHGSYNKTTIKILKKIKIKYGLSVKHGIIDLKKN